MLERDPRRGRYSRHVARKSIRDRLARLEPPGRVPGLDIARALALIGMFAAHLLYQEELVWSDPATWSGLVNGRPSILFATLAGVSLALTEDPRPRDSASSRRRSSVRIAVRAALIWSVGALLVAWTVPVYVILQTYGILFLVAILLLRLRTPALLLTAAVIAVAGPYLVAMIAEIPVEDPRLAESLFLNLGWNYPFVAWAAFIAAGIAVGRLLKQPTAARSAALIGVGVVLAVIGYGAIGPIGDRASAAGADSARSWWLAVLQDAPHSTGVGEMVGSGGFAIAVIGACVLLGMTGLRRPLWPLRAVGSMPLSAYTAQLVIWIWWFVAESSRPGATVLDPGSGFRATEPFWPVTLGIIAGGSLWALLIGRGPLEALVSRVASIVAALSVRTRRRSSRR